MQEIYLITTVFFIIANFSTYLGELQEKKSNQIVYMKENTSQN